MLQGLLSHSPKLEVAESYLSAVLGLWASGRVDSGSSAAVAAVASESALAVSLGSGLAAACSETPTK